MNNQRNLFSAALITILVLLGFLVYKSQNNLYFNQGLITSFEECAKAGNQIMESYPRKCKTEDGRLFSEIINNPGPVPVPAEGCYVGGCSGQICSDQAGAASTCEYREEYACYKTAKCERQTSGKCGWTQTTALSSCLKNSGNRIAAGYVAGHVTIGPFCPVERLDQPCQVPVEAYTSREAVVYASDGNTVNDKVHLDTQGNYKIALAPGNYFIQIKPAGIGPGEKKNVTIKSFETAVVNFDIDTGIR